MDYQKNRFVDVRQLVVTVRSAPLDSLQLLGKRSCIAGDSLKLHITGTDVYGNQVEELDRRDLVVEPA